MLQQQSVAEANRLMERQRLGGEPDSASSLVPMREETCCVCNQAGVLVDDGWYEDASVEHDAETGDYLAGEGYLVEAEDTPSGWVCSTRCESQAMYQRQDERGRKALDKVADACCVIDEYGDCARGVVNKLTSEFVGEELVIQARKFLHSVRAEDPNNPPDWLNRPSREERMERVLEEVKVTAEWIGKGLFGPEKAKEIVEKIREALRALGFGPAFGEALCEQLATPPPARTKQERVEVVLRKRYPSTPRAAITMDAAEIVEEIAKADQEAAHDK